MSNLFSNKVNSTVTTYKATSGDTLKSIASKAGVSVDALVKANPSINSNTKLSKGQTIVIYTPKYSDTVKPGEVTVKNPITSLTKKAEVDKKSTTAQKPYDPKYVNVNALSEGEVRSILKRMLEPEYNLDVKNTNTRYDDMINEQSGIKEKRAKTFNNAIKQLEDVFAANKQEVSNQALNRGLGRSSIVLMLHDAVNKRKENSVQALQNDYLGQLQDIDNQINKLYRDREDALSSLAVKYNGKLDTEADKRLKAQQQTIQDAFKWNAQEYYKAYNSAK